MKRWFARPWSPPPRRRAPRPRRLRPHLEQLEDRVTPASLMVTTVADDLTPNDGSVSLREALTAVNAIKGLVINRFQADGSFNGGVGVLVLSNGNTIAGNFIGVQPDVPVQSPNGGDGIRIVNASNNVIGGTGPGNPNVVAGNMLD